MRTATAMLAVLTATLRSDEDLEIEAAQIRANSTRHWAMLTDNEHLAARFAVQLNHMIAARPRDWRRS